MRDWYTHFRTNQRSGKRGIYIAIDQNHVGMARAHYRLESVDNGRGLLGVGTRPYTEINVGLRHSELLEEHLGHGGVVMLSGVNQRLTYGRMRPKRTQNRGGFHEVGARADDVENVHGD